MSSRSRLLLRSDGADSTGDRVRVVDLTALSPDDRVLDLARQTLGRLAADLGADGLPTVAWSGLPTVRHLSALWQARDGLLDPQVDEVVIRASSVQALRELAEAPSACLRLVDAAMTPRVAMWRGGDPEPPRELLFEALSRARGVLVSLVDMLEHPSTRVLVPYWDDVAAAQFWVLGVGVEDRHESAPALSAASMRIHQDDGRYELQVAVPEWAAPQVRVGRASDDVVLAVGPTVRFLPLPPVLRRCRAVDAVLAGGELRVRFDQDAAQWPASRQESP